jgi:hypothetical protein
MAEINIAKMEDESQLFENGVTSNIKMSQGGIVVQPPRKKARVALQKHPAPPQSKRKIIWVTYLVKREDVERIYGKAFLHSTLEHFLLKLPPKFHVSIAEVPRYNYMLKGACFIPRIKFESSSEILYRDFHADYDIADWAAIFRAVGVRYKPRRITFLLGLITMHPQTGAISPIRRAFVRHSLAEPQLLRIIFSFAFYAQ